MVIVPSDMTSLFRLYFYMFKLERNSVDIERKKSFEKNLFLNKNFWNFFLKNFFWKFFSENVCFPSLDFSKSKSNFGVVVFAISGYVVLMQVDEVFVVDKRNRMSISQKRSFFVRMVSDPKCYNPKIVRTLSMTSRRNLSDSDTGVQTPIWTQSARFSSLHILVINQSNPLQTLHPYVALVVGEKLCLNFLIPLNSTSSCIWSIFPLVTRRHLCHLLQFSMDFHAIRHRILAPPLLLRRSCEFSVLSFPLARFRPILPHQVVAPYLAFAYEVLQFDSSIFSMKTILISSLCTNNR